MSLLSSIYFLFQYFKFLPYYNTSVSFVFGAMLGVYFWISLNALLAQLYSMVGFVTIIFIGLPFVDLKDMKIDADILAMIPEPIARNHNIIAFKKNKDSLE